VGETFEKPAKDPTRVESEEKHASEKEKEDNGANDTPARKEPQETPPADKKNGGEGGEGGVGGFLERWRGRTGAAYAAYGFRLVRFAVGAIVVIFVSALLYASLVEPDIFKSATQLTAAMAAAFAVIAGMVSAYFGIKAGLDGQDRVNDGRDRERENARKDLEDERKTRREEEELRRRR
jgi:hypothetical protein